MTGACKTKTGAGSLSNFKWYRNLRPPDAQTILQRRSPWPGIILIGRLTEAYQATMLAAICQHTHIVGCYECYEGTPIIYGQGNFIFDYPTSRRSWSEGVLISLSFTKTECAAIEFIPTTQACQDGAVSLLKGDDRARILDGLEARSKVLADPDQIERQWAMYCETIKRYYLNSLHGRAGIIRRIVGRLGYLQLLEPRKKNLARLNLVRCESHREVLMSVLTDIQKN